MEGSRGVSEKGVISRAFEHIFEAISVTDGVKYLALASYLEIYNEQIRFGFFFRQIESWNIYFWHNSRDLLLPSEKLSLNNSLNLKELPNEGLIVPGEFKKYFIMVFGIHLISLGL